MPGNPPLFDAIKGHRPDVLRRLLASGESANQTDAFGDTPLVAAVEHDDLDCVAVLLAAGADVDQNAPETALSKAETREIAQQLLDAGADPAYLSHDGRRALAGLPPVHTGQPLPVTLDDFVRGRTRVFGAANPERMRQPFWEAMIRAGVNSYAAERQFDAPSSRVHGPIWCAQRFGQSITQLPDGRVVLIAGEHEDATDPDFCIYNDVFVHAPDGSIAVFGYPSEVFPPTDFHTATLVDDHIFIIGSVGYIGTRRHGETPLYRLDVRTMSIEPLTAGGDAPGWIFGHRADRIAPNQIRVSKGTIISAGASGQEVYADNADTFVLDLGSLSWRRCDTP